MDYKIEELVLIVGRLAEKYTGFESIAKTNASFLYGLFQRNCFVNIAKDTDWVLQGYLYLFTICCYEKSHIQGFQD